MNARAPKTCTCPRVRHVHGTMAAYNRCGCRCTACTKANRSSERLRQLDHLSGRARMVDATGVRRRLQALHAIGWTSRLIGEQLGMQPSPYSALLNTRAQVRVATKERVNAVYDALWNRTPPTATPYERRAATRARNTARRKGWLGPLHWNDEDLDRPEARPVVLVAGGPACQSLPPRHGELDEVVVLRALAGENVPLTRAERLTVVQELHSRGLLDGQICLRTGIGLRQVQRDRQRLALPANHPPGKSRASA